MWWTSQLKGFPVVTWYRASRWFTHRQAVHWALVLNRKDDDDE